MNKTIYFIRVLCKGNNNPVRIQSIWDNEKAFNLRILEGRNAFSATIIESQIYKLAEECKISVDEYIPLLKKSLSDNNLPDFNYDLVNNELKIYRKDSKISFLYANFILNPMIYEKCAEEFIDDFKNLIMFYENEIKKIDRNRKDALNAQKLSEKELEKFITLKEDTEHTLYSSFILVLNEKKRRIQDLQELVNRYKNNPMFNSDDETCSENSNVDENVMETNDNLHDISASETENSSDEGFQVIEHTASIENVPMSKEDNLEENEISLPKRMKKEEYNASEISPAEPTTKTIENIDENINLQSSGEIDFDTQDILNRM